ncbi:MAG: 4-(cytidine 5'-diphospho)-2-C-methyl-D-erythritol kinase [Intestinibacillus sp.]
MIKEKQIRREAYAKINLTLDVTGKRPDGYHTVKMVMQSVALHDDVTVRLTDGGGYRLENNLSFLPNDHRNLAMRAARLFYERTGLANPGTEIDIVKRIPVAAGLAGGSTDAAAVLRALDTLHGTAMDDATLCAYGLALGADVPYCLLGGTMLAEGIGEKLTPLPSMPRCHVVLVKPPFSVSTAEVYAQMNGGNVSPRPDTAGMLAALRAGDYPGVCHRLYNVMEPVTGGRHPEIAEIRDTLLSCGADGAVMSGSGPTTYGLFTDVRRARAAYETLAKRYPETHLTEVLV